MRDIDILGSVTPRLNMIFLDTRYSALKTKLSRLSTDWASGFRFFTRTTLRGCGVACPAAPYSENKRFGHAASHSLCSRMSMSCSSQGKVCKSNSCKRPRLPRSRKHTKAAGALGALLLSMAMIVLSVFSLSAPLNASFCSDEKEYHVSVKAPAPLGPPSSKFATIGRGENRGTSLESTR